MNSVLIVLFLYFSPAILQQTSETVNFTPRQKIYSYYISNRMQDWKLFIDKMAAKSNQSASEKLELLEYQYGYIAWCIGVERDEEAAEYLKKAWKIAEQLEKQKYRLSSVYAYKAAFYGYEIGLGPWIAPVYGPKSMNHAKKAIEANADDPIGYIQLGNMQFYMPAAFGGSKTEAINYYRKAILMIENKKNTKGNWMYLSLLATLGQAYEIVGKQSEAEQIYRKALATEPDFLYVSKELLPKLKR